MPSAAAAPSTLQIAQILADLQTLQNSDPTAALNLLSANKTLTAGHVRRKSQAVILPEPPKFDNLGRRIVGAPSISTSTHTDALACLSSVNGTVNGTGDISEVRAPGVEGDDEVPDQDLIRAKNLLELFGMKDRFKQMGTIGLTRSKQEVEAVIAKYARMELEERENVAAARHLGVPST